MFRKYLLPLVAVAGVLFAIYSVIATSRPQLVAQPASSPALSPYDKKIAGAGLVEANTQNISIGTLLAGVVTKVSVIEGQDVRKDDELFRLDDRSLQAEKRLRESALKQSQQRLAKLKLQPRPEDVPPAEAKVNEAQANVNDAQEQFALMNKITDLRAVSQEDLAHRKFAVAAAEARLAQAKADLATIKAGAWEPDKIIAQAEVDNAEAALKSVETDLDRLVVQAPVSGTVLQVNVRVGEYAMAGMLSTPLMMMGNLDPLYVRVDVDENDAHRMRPGAPATANPRGDSSRQIELKFVRIEPFVIPKRSLTGDTTERVDTRVLQVLYSFERSQAPYVWPGQQMDVHISDLSRSESASQPATQPGR